MSNEEQGQAFYLQLSRYIQDIEKFDVLVLKKLERAKDRKDESRNLNIDFSNHWMIIRLH